MLRSRSIKGWGSEVQHSAAGGAQVEQADQDEALPSSSCKAEGGKWTQEGRPVGQEGGGGARTPAAGQVG